MWINNNIAKPLRKGYYKTLVEWDDFGSVQEVSSEYFDGNDWSHHNSCRQFISFWWSERDEYKIIIDRLEKERDKNLEL